MKKIFVGLVIVTAVVLCMVAWYRWNQATPDEVISSAVEVQIVPVFVDVDSLQELRAKALKAERAGPIYFADVVRTDTAMLRDAEAIAELAAAARSAVETGLSPYSSYDSPNMGYYRLTAINSSGDSTVLHVRPFGRINVNPGSIFESEFVVPKQFCHLIERMLQLHGTEGPRNE